jgi:DNA-directed RNA polymerase subunit RPC12/RpoP
MGVRFACHACGKKLNIKEELAGKRGRCPACGLRFRIPPHDQEFSLPLEEGEGELAGASGAAAGDIDNPLLSNLDEEQQPTVKASGAEADFDPFTENDFRWYVRPPGGGRYGPADGATIRQWIAEGRVTANTLLWREGWAEWRELGEFLPDAFVGRGPAVTQVAATTQAPTATQSATSAVHVESPGSVLSTDYLAARKQQKARRRAQMIAILIALSVFLVIAIVFALVFNTGEVGEFGQ